jgi:phosphatidate cytidylyltransferase
MDMERLIYIIILLYFILGAIGFYFINRKKEPAVAKKSYIKLVTYFFIINILFFSITIQPFVFHLLTIIIIGVACLELNLLFIKSNSEHLSFFIVSIAVFVVFALCFLHFSFLKKELTLFTFLILSIFDSFSQITGQLWGRTKILPKVSPNKTLGGLVGGTIVSIISAFLLKDLFVGSMAGLFIFTFGTLLFAFAGDTLSSLFKRKYKVKDFNNIIPGHGGFLDRFDSLIAGGAWAALYFQFIAP